MPDIKLIGLDLDGTLLTTTKELTENTKKVLIQALDAGIEVLVATGRPFSGIPKGIQKAAWYSLCAYLQWSPSPGYPYGKSHNRTASSSGKRNKGSPDL